MFIKILQTLLSSIIVCVIAFEDTIYVYAEVSQEMVDQGRMQYQLLQERGSLPRYGACWKSAVDHVENGCRALSEDTQSDMALHITNCFLEMSGHETYNCELDKKPNLRGICISQMSDRAFNVYTEFYTHTQNICWFLRGQVWHEAIAENTLRVGRQLEASARNQDEILESQKESLKLQGKLLQYGQNLEKILEDFYISTRQHQEILSVMNTSLGSLQSWLVGELSWFDLVVFYIAAGILICIFTSSSRTASARLPILFLLVVNAIIERLICAALVSNTLQNEIYLVQSEIYKYIWWSRKTFVFLAILILVYKGCAYQDLARVNNGLLQKIYQQNLSISDSLQKMSSRNVSSNGEVSFLNESRSLQDCPSYNNLSLNGSCKTNHYLEKRDETYEKTVIRNGVDSTSYDNRKNVDIVRNTLSMNQSKRSETPREKASFNRLISGRQKLPSYTLVEPSNGRYNLRNKQGTPDYNI